MIFFINLFWLDHMLLLGRRQYINTILSNDTIRNNKNNYMNITAYNNYNYGRFQSKLLHYIRALCILGQL